MVAVTHIYELASSLIASVSALYSAEGLTLPSRHAITEGSPAWDCEQLTVSLARTFPGEPNNPDLSRCNVVRTGVFNIAIVRCTSSPDDNGAPPDPTTIESFSYPILIDAWFLPSALAEAIANGSLGAACDDISIGELTVAEPEGGFGGVNLTLEWLLGNG